MKLGFIGLGRMGTNMVMNLLDKKNRVVVYNRTPNRTKDLSKKGAIPSYDFKELLEKLPKQKVIWIMIKSGKPVDDVIKSLLPNLNKGDIVIDGGNSYFEDSQRRYKLLKKKGINFLDVGVSGGIMGARHGASMMVGGDKRVFSKLNGLFKDLCVKDGFAYVGESGAGHYVKMVHNGIEYGMTGAIAEGFEALNKYQGKFKFNIPEITKVYANGSIIEGKLTKWLWDAYKNPKYKEVSCEVPKGETEDEMKKLEKMARMPILHTARLERVRSRKMKFCGSIISILRNRFGGHEFKRKK